MRCAACCSCCACELTIITKATTRALPSATPSCEGWLPDQTSVSTILGARLIVVLIEELGCLALEPLLGGSWRGGPPTWAQGHTEGAQRRDEHQRIRPCSHRIRTCVHSPALREEETAEDATAAGTGAADTTDDAEAPPSSRATSAAKSVRRGSSTAQASRLLTATAICAATEVISFSLFVLFDCCQLVLDSRRGRSSDAF